jgi:hypothetical protein
MATSKELERKGVGEQRAEAGQMLQRDSPFQMYSKAMMTKRKGA